MARPPIPIDAPDFDPEKSKWIRMKLAKGIDYGVKSPFKLTLRIPSGGLAFSHKTDFCDLQNIAGSSVALKYYPNRNARVAVRIESNRHVRMGVKASVYVPQISKKPLIIDEYGRRKRSKRSIFCKKEFFNFGIDLMDAKKFANNERIKEEDGVEITVEGYAFYWDERRYKAREAWRFQAGVTGYYHRWGSLCEEEVYGMNQEFEAPDRTLAAGNLIILAKNSEVFDYIIDHTLGDPAPINVPYSREVAEIGVKLCYDYRLVEHIPFDQKVKLLLFLDEFKVSNYKEQLENHLLEYVDFANLGDLVQAAHDGHSEILRQRCLNYMRKCIRTGTFFLGYQKPVVRQMILEAVETDMWHEWLLPIFHQDWN